jgi:hypothetical protein
MTAALAILAGASTLAGDDATTLWSEAKLIGDLHD